MPKSILSCILVLFVFSFTAFAQKQISIHQLSYEQHKSDVWQRSLFNDDGRDIIPLKYNKSNLSSAVFGYLPYWEYPTAKSTLQYNLLTHIAATSFAASASGGLSKPSYWPWTDVINAAHANGVKIIMCVVNFTASDIHTLVTTASNKNTLFANIGSFISQYNLDGVNIDFESLNTADRGALINTFMSDLTTYIHTNYPGKEVSFAGPAINWGGWNLPGLVNACDYVFIMGYDFYGSWSTVTGPSSPLTGGSTNLNTALTSTSMGYGGVINSTPQKLILGVPYYGNEWYAKTENAYAAVTDFRATKTYYGMSANALSYGTKWDNTSQTPWYSYKLDTTCVQGWFDNDSSLGLKYDFATSKKLKGVGMWALGQDGSRTELWNLLKNKFYNAGFSISGKVLYNNSALTPLEGVSVNLYKDTVQVGTAVTNTAGEFLFGGMLPNGYSITTKSNSLYGGANSTDALLIRQYIIGQKTFDSLQLKAADVNSSGSVSSTDALLIRQRTAGIINSFTSGDWIFEKPYFILSNADTVINIRALCAGDVNGSYMPGAKEHTNNALQNSNKVKKEK